MKSCKVIALFWLWLPLYLVAQNPYYLKITKQNGLPSNNIYDLYEGRNGFIWIVGEHGIARYDGFEYKIYTHPLQKSKSGTNIKEDKYGRIWYATFDGFFYYIEHDSLKIANIPHNASSYDYVLLDDLLFYLDNDVVTIYNIAEQKKVKEISFSQDKKPKSLAGLWRSGKYIYLFDRDSYLYKIDSQGNKEKVISANELWFAPLKISVANLSDTLLVIPHKDSGQLNTWVLLPNQKPQKLSLGLSHLPIQALRSTKDGRLWFLSTQGAAVFTYKDNELVYESSFFPEHSISAVLKDREGNHWIGTTNEGLLFVPSMNTYLYKAPDFKPFRLTTLENSLYIGTKYDELYQLRADLSMPKRILKNKERHEIYVLYADSMANLLYTTSRNCKVVSASGKLLKTSGGAVKAYQRIDHKYLAHSSTGTFGLIYQPLSQAPSKWDSLYRAYIQYLYEEEACFFNKEACRAKSLTFLPQKNLLFYATNIGLYQVSPKEIKELHYKGEKVYMYIVDSYGNTAYGLTGNNQVFQISSEGELSPILAANVMVQRIKVASHYLFAWADKQLLVADLSQSKLYFQKCDPSVPADEINDILFWQDNLVIATDEGLLYKSWTDAQILKEHPLFRINQLSVNGMLFFPKENITLSYDQNDVEIKYSILSFRLFTDITLFYRINGGEWQLASKDSRTLKLAALAPDTYEIDFRLGDAPNSPIQGIQFTIQPPFWRRAWFWLTIFALLSGVATLFYLSRTNLLKKQNQLLTEKLLLESELRSSLVEKLKLEGDLRQSLLSSIKSQMNPHFFFNALNTIQSFIFSDDKRNAASYLGKFARLMRMILEMSEKEQVSLQEEIQALSMYLDLENIRFNYSLHYEIEVAQGLDTTRIHIPSMIIQPYVENAVKHGLLHQKGEKNLKVQIQQQNDCLEVRIEDNGIGRKRSAELNKIKQKKHQHHSFATQANLKRIELLNKENPRIGVQYIDKEEDNNHATGTIVLITLPLIHATGNGEIV